MIVSLTRQTFIDLFNLLLLGLIAGGSVLHCAEAGELSVKVVYKNHTNSVANYFELIKSNKSADSLELIALKEFTANANGSSLIIAIGHEALLGVMNKPIDVPILAVFISRLSFERVVNSVPKRRGISAIFSDPDPANQIRLAKLLYKKNIEIAILLSRDTAFLEPEFRRAAKINDTRIKLVTVSHSTNLYKTLSRISSCDVLLAIPDNAIYNRQSIRNILLTTYRHNQSILGFSKGMVKAGALATTAVDVSDMANETQRWLSKYFNKKRVLKPAYSRKFGVFVNEYVARSLDVYTDTESIKQKMKLP